MDRTQLHVYVNLARELVLTSPLVTFLRPAPREALGEATERSGFSVEFRDYGEGTSETNCTLYVEYEYLWGQPKHNEAGDTVTDSHLKVELNWPCHGSSSTEKSAARLAFYARVLELANEIQNALPSQVTVVVMTKAEREERDKRLAEEAKAQQLQFVLKQAADHVRSGLRVGADKYLSVALLPGVPQGEHTIAIDDYNGKVKREYVITVYEASAYLRRTK